MARDESLADILYEARQKKGLTQVSLAQKAKIYPNTYAKIERGEQKPSIPTIKKLAKALDIDLATLMKAWS